MDTFVLLVEELLNFLLLKAVKDLGYKRMLSLEYKADKDEPLPGMMECFGCVSGILATM